MKKTIFTVLAAVGAMTASAQSIDFNFANRSEAEVNEPDYVPWAVNQVASEADTLDNGLVVIVSASGNATQLRSQWNKNTCQAGKNGQTGLRLMGDGVAAFIVDEDNNTPTLTDTPTSIQVIVKGLSAGSHSVAAYHVWKDAITGEMPKIQLELNSKVVQTNVEYANVKNPVTDLKMADAPFSYVEFEIENDGDSVTLNYTTLVESGKTYQTTNMMLNGLLIDRSPLVAMDPVPNNKDYHLDADDGNYTLEWAAATVAVSHKLVLGTDSATVAASTDYVYTGTETQYSVSSLKPYIRYYWRVDEVDAEGKVYKGNVWSFQPRMLAFADAEGYGRYARGGRGGVVYHVTNLENDHEPGSLLYGLVDMTGPRTIVFDVSGTIDMGFEAIFVQPYVTIAGQTAPGKGICIKSSNINICSDCICRFMRFKRGIGEYGGEYTGNAMGMSGADHAIVDHCVAAWGTDETVSGRGAKNISFQYSMIAEALGITGHKNYDDGTNHGYAATIDGQIGSWHHNLLAHCYGRNWSMGGGMDANNTAIGQMDIFNNVVYNWGTRTTDGGCHECNFVGNYYKMGPASTKTILYSQDYENVGSEESTWQAYVSGNIRDNKDGSLTQDAYNNTYRYTLSNGAAEPTYNVFVNEAFFPSYADIHSAKDAYKIVTSYAGATMPEPDDQHKRIVKETLARSYTYTGSKSGLKGEIDDEADCGGFEEYPEEQRASDYDPDQDGVPSWFEVIVGTDPAVADQNQCQYGDGWTRLEDYLEFVAHPNAVLNANEETTVDVAQYFAGFTNSPAYTVQPKNVTDVTASISGSTMTIKAGANSAVVTLLVTVTDGDGSTFTRKFNVAVAGAGTGIETVSAAAEANAVCYDLFGRQLPAAATSGLVLRNGAVKLYSK
ncbi:MAG: hypothetical protein K6E86_03565 [Bacteroidales bacterium]|nr:hypothetical protein [Bacteroidales bacterium]